MNVNFLSTGSDVPRNQPGLHIILIDLMIALYFSVLGL